MPGIFISYRRIDTAPWAGRLFDHLSKRFGKSQVFMDIAGSIPRGANFERVLTNALNDCSVLLALIGPKWISCTYADGRRRLDVPEDWVRNEIATALRRKIYIIPIRFDGAPFPEKRELPEDLHGLCDVHYADVTDSRWDYDVGGIIEDLIQHTSLQPVDDDVDSAITGIRLLRKLLDTMPAVAEAMGRSKEVIESTSRQIDKLAFFKEIHGALHMIECECLQPIQEGKIVAPLRLLKLQFAKRTHQIQQAIDSHETDDMQRDDLLEQLDLDRLKLVEVAFQNAVAQPSEAASRQLVGALDVLLSGAPPKLDTGIAYTARELNLDRLVELMTTVRDLVPAVAMWQNAELKPFFESIDALSRLRDDLTQRVAEHTRLQHLDSKLRSVCVGGIAPEVVASEWGRIKRVRTKLMPPFSAELKLMIDDLVVMESDIDAAVGQDEGQKTLDRLWEYFRTVRFVFHSADEKLKDLCFQLSTVSQPLKIILSML
jgi:hypothetical protein